MNAELMTRMGLPALDGLPIVHAEGEEAMGGGRLRLTFANGYTSSIVRTAYSYGSENGLFEVAIMHDGHLCYDTPVTDDVLGRLSVDDVEEAVRQIASLPRREAL